MDNGALVEINTSKIDTSVVSAHSPLHQPSSLQYYSPSQHVELRRSTRTSSPPLWTQDFFMPTIKSPPFSIENFMQYDHPSTSVCCYLSQIEHFTKPLTFQEAEKDLNWVKAMETEINALQENNTWELIDLPQDKHVVGCKWVYKPKFHSDGMLNAIKHDWLQRGTLNKMEQIFKKPSHT